MLEKDYNKVNDYLKSLNGKTIMFCKSKKIKTLGDIFDLALIHNVPTYWSNNGKLQCQSNRRRSAVDIYLLCQYYKFKISYEDIVNIFAIIGNSTNRNYCTTVERNTYRFQKYYKLESENYSGKLFNHVNEKNPIGTITEVITDWKKMLEKINKDYESIFKSRSNTPNQS